MSGKKAKLQRKLEREQLGTDTVAFKRSRMDKIVEVRRKNSEEARARAEARKAELDNLAKLARERQEFVRQGITPGERVKRIGVLGLPSAAMLAAVVGLGMSRRPADVQDVLAGELKKPETEE